MNFYIISILLDMAFISVCDILILHTSLHLLSAWYCIYQVAINVIYIIVIDILVVCIAYFACPKKWFNPYNRNYHVSKKERKIYDFLKIRKWKDKIPAGIGFRKDKVYEKDNPNYIYMFLQDSATAEMEHFITLLAGWIIVFLNPFTPLKYALCFTIPVCLVHTILHLMPVMVQRYNRPKLMLLYSRLKQKQIETGGVPVVLNSQSD